MAHAALIAIVFVAGCGRISFDARSDGGASGDGGPRDGSTVIVDSPVSNGLVAWYRFDEAGATDRAFDWSGNGHDAICDSLCPEPDQDRFNTLNRALLFDGSATVMVVPTSDGFFDLSTFTVAVWFYPQRAMPNPFEMLVARPFGTSYENSFALDVADNGRLEYYAQPDNTFYSITPYALTTWQHAAITFDGSEKRIYYNGAFEAETSAAAPVTYDSHAITIGADISSENYAYHFLGSLDDVMIFNRALSTAEIAQLAQ